MKIHVFGIGEVPLSAPTRLARDYPEPVPIRILWNDDNPRAFAPAKVVRTAPPPKRRPKRLPRKTNRAPFNIHLFNPFGEQAGRENSPEFPSSKFTAHGSTFAEPESGESGERPGEGLCRSLWKSFLAFGALALLCAVPVQSATFRWVPSSSRIYVENGGTATLSDIKAAVPAAPLDVVDATNRVWQLRAHLWITDGCTLRLHGTNAGGDVNELRLQSNNTTATNNFITVNADYGTLDIQATKITSWDSALNGPDTETAVHGRAYLRVRSSLSTNGVTANESRMDIMDSDVGYLGYDASESYGLTWKVGGSISNLYDLVAVRGNILRSRIHHNFFGVYTYGAQDCQWLNNEVDHNIQYGLDPHDDSDALLIAGNNIHHNGDHGLIAADRCDQLIITNNLSWANAENGIILYRSGNNSLIASNRCTDNGDSGIALTASSTNTVRNNLVAGNQSAGLRLDLGSAFNLLEANQSISNAQYGIYLYKGSATPEPNDDGRPKRNLFINNQVHDNGSDGLSVDDSDDNTFANNNFYANGDKLHFERGYRNRLDGNVIPTNVTLKASGNTNGTPATSTYVRNQSYLKVQVDTNSAAIFEDDDGRIYDPSEANVFTDVAANGSTLFLSAPQIGTTSTVVARDLWVSASNGVAAVNPVDWTNAPVTSREWSVRAASPSQSLSFTVGGLGVNQSYPVSKDGDPLTTVHTDGEGFAVFTDVPGTTNEVDYVVEPYFEVTASKTAGGMAVWFTGGRLQSTTNLMPAYWRDVPVTNGQFKVNIKTTNTMEFFRVVAP